MYICGAAFHTCTAHVHTYLTFEQVVSVSLNELSNVPEGHGMHNETTSSQYSPSLQTWIQCIYQINVCYHEHGTSFSVATKNKCVLLVW